MTMHHRGRATDWHGADRAGDGTEAAGPRGPASLDPVRPAWVPGPGGTRITIADLPPPTTTRWVVRRKAEVLAAVNGGLLTATEACARYGLSPEELELWQQAVDRAGVPGLRVTRIQLYRELDRIRPSAKPPVAPSLNPAPSRPSLQA